MAHRLHSLAVAALVAVALARPAPARAEELPARNQALLLLRVLAYDRNLAQRANGAVTVAVVFRPGDRGSEERRAALLAAFEEVARDVVVAGLPVKVEAIPFRDAADFEARLEAVAAGPGLRRPDAAEGGAGDRPGHPPARGALGRRQPQPGRGRAGGRGGGAGGPGRRGRST